MENNIRVERSALKQLKEAYHLLTKQQYKTLKGQVISGNPDGAMKGLEKILGQKGMSESVL